jgi:hypothetical protein
MHGRESNPGAAAKIAKIAEVGVRKPKMLNSQCINYIGIYENYSRLFRCAGRYGRIWGSGITDKVVWHVVKKYAKATRLQKLFPHDCRRYAECRIMPNRNQDLRFGA